MCLSIRALAVATALLPAAWAGAGPPHESPPGAGTERSTPPSRTSSLRSISRPTTPGKLGGTFSNPGQRLHRLSAVEREQSTAKP